MGILGPVHHSKRESKQVATMPENNERVAAMVTGWLALADCFTGWLALDLNTKYLSLDTRCGSI